jgi:hypothetical protein
MVDGEALGGNRSVWPHVQRNGAPAQGEEWGSWGPRATEPGCGAEPHLKEK